MSTWVRADDVLWHHTLDTVVVLAAGRDEPVTIRGSGVDVWHRLATTTPLGELIDGLSEAYGRPAARIARDVLPFLEELRRLGAVTRAP